MVPGVDRFPDRIPFVRCLLFVLCAASAHAQPAAVIPTPPSFDEASVTRSHAAGTDARIDLPARLRAPDRFVAANITGI